MAGNNGPPRLVGLELGSLGGTTSAANAVNDAGQVTGWANKRKSVHAFLWSRGKMTDLGTFGSGKLNSSAYGINRSGQVVGASEINADLAYHAFLWSKGKMLDLGTLDPNDEEIDSEALAVNDRGLAVGWSDVDAPSGDLASHAVLWSAGTQTDLGTFVGSGDLSSEADDINNSGQVVGWSDISGGEHMHAFMWSNGTMTDLGTLGTYRDSYAVAINEAGQVVGASWSITSSGGRTRRVDHAFLWSDGTVRNLGTLGGESSYATDINDSGEAVGASQTRSGRWHAFFWSRGKMFDLGALGAHDSGADGLNSSGDVVGAIQWGANAKVQHSHAVLWTSAKKVGRTTVPNLMGMTLTAAHDAIARSEGSFGRLRRSYSGHVKAGRVMSQSPRAGARVRWGTKINLAISRGRHT
jgi:probable HAF family extracellular repeat protein